MEVIIIVIIFYTLCQYVLFHVTKASRLEGVSWAWEKATFITQENELYSAFIDDDRLIWTIFGVTWKKPNTIYCYILVYHSTITMHFKAIICTLNVAFFTEKLLLLSKFTLLPYFCLFIIIGCYRYYSNFSIPVFFNIVYQKCRTVWIFKLFNTWRDKLLLFLLQTHNEE